MQVPHRIQVERDIRLLVGMVRTRMSPVTARLQHDTESTHILLPLIVTVVQLYPLGS